MNCRWVNALTEDAQRRHVLSPFRLERLRGFQQPLCKKECQRQATHFATWNPGDAPSLSSILFYTDMLLFDPLWPFSVLESQTLSRFFLYLFVIFSTPVQRLVNVFVGLLFALLSRSRPVALSFFANTLAGFTPDLLRRITRTIFHPADDTRFDKTAAASRACTMTFRSVPRLLIEPISAWQYTVGIRSSCGTSTSWSSWTAPQVKAEAKYIKVPAALCHSMSLYI